jgi:hypothetical protein
VNELAGKAAGAAEKAPGIGLINNLYGEYLKQGTKIATTAIKKLEEQLLKSEGAKFYFNVCWWSIKDGKFIPGVWVCGAQDEGSAYGVKTVAEMVMLKLACTKEIGRRMQSGERPDGKEIEVPVPMDKGGRAAAP